MKKMSAMAAQEANGGRDGYYACRYCGWKLPFGNKFWQYVLPSTSMYKSHTHANRYGNYKYVVYF